MRYASIADPKHAIIESTPRVIVDFEVPIPSNGVYVSAISSRVRKVTPAGIISTVAGGVIYGPVGDGGPATSAYVRPSGIAVDAAGNLYIADGANRRLRKVSPEGIIST